MLLHAHTLSSSPRVQPFAGGDLAQFPFYDDQGLTSCPLWFALASMWSIDASSQHGQAPINSWNFVAAAIVRKQPIRKDNRMLLISSMPRVPDTC